MKTTDDRAHDGTGAAVERTYATSPQELFRVAHDQLSTGATFTLDSEDAANGVITFHSFEDESLTLTLVAQGAAGTTVRLVSAAGPGSKRIQEFLKEFDSRLGVPQTGSPIPTASAATKDKRTSKLAIFAIILGALFVIASFSGLYEAWGALITATVIFGLFAGFSLYVTRKGGKVQGRVLAWVAVGIVAFGFLVGAVTATMHSVEAAKLAKEEALLEQEEEKVDCGSIAWPTSGVGSSLPQPETLTGEVRTDSSDSFSVALCSVTKDQFNAYVEKVKSSGFTVDYSKSDTTYDADNKAGDSISISHGEDGDDIMSIRVTAAEEDESDDSAPKQDTGGQSKEAQPEQKQPQSASDDAVTAALDSYEQLMNGYVDFMKKYQDSGNPVDMLADYTKMQAQYADAMKKLDAIDQDTLTREQTAHYIEVTSRVAQKLATVGQ